MKSKGKDYEMKSKLALLTLSLIIFDLQVAFAQAGPAGAAAGPSAAAGISVHSMPASPMAPGLFQKAIVESGGSRDSVLTARPISKDGVDPNYPVSAETIG